MFPFLMQPAPLMTDLKNKQQAELQIDEKLLEKSEGNRDDFYVPKDKTGKVLVNSGVTIGKGFDLGQVTPQRFEQILNRISNPFERNSLRTQLSPFVGAKKENAVEALKQQQQVGNKKLNPLVVADLNKAVIEQYKEDAAVRFSETTGIPMSGLNPKAQQVLFEINYHTLDPDKPAAHPNVAAFNRIATALAQDNTADAIKAIKAHPQYKKFKSRYNSYINMLRGLK